MSTGTTTTAEPGTVYLTPADVAERWSISTGHLANQRHLGTGLPYVRIGSRILYDLADVAAVERAGRVEPVAR